VLHESEHPGHPVRFALVTASAVGARSKESVVPRLAIIGCGLIAVATMMLGVALASSDKPTIAVVWGGLALTTYAAGLVCLAGVAGPYDDLGLARWKLGPWLLTWYGLAFGLATVTWHQPLTTGVSAEIAVSSVLRALWLVAVGMTAWMVGYCIPHRQPTRAGATRAIALMRGRFSNSIRGIAAPWILFAVGVAASFASSASIGRFGYLSTSSTASGASGFSGIFGALSLCGPLAVAAAAVQAFRDRMPYAWVSLLLLLVADLTLGALAGGKQSFVIAALATMIPFSAARNKLPKLAGLIVVILFVAVVIPFNQAYRHVAHQKALVPGEVVAEAPSILGQTLTGSGDVMLLPDSFDFLAQRIREIDNPAIIIQRAPGQVSFLDPLQLVLSPIAGFVPRMIWSDKPIRTTGLQFSQEFYELPPTTASADTAVGGLYWYGGWIPLVIGMLLLGWGIRVLDEVLDVRANPHAIFLVLLLFPTLVKGEDDWQTILISIPATLFVWLVAVAIMFRTRRA
jgi:hypothetical protein